MTLLWFAVVMTACVAGAALALAALLASRYRALQAHVAERLEHLQAPSVMEGLPAPGRPVREFTATAVDGSQVGSADLAGDDVLLLFLVVGCSTCSEELPRFREVLARPRARALRPVVVVGSPGEGHEPYVEALSDVARVVVETTMGTVVDAFGVALFPAAVVAGGGQVRQAAISLDELTGLAEPVTA